MKKYRLRLGLLLIVALQWSCNNDDITITPETPLGAFENGILISNEGPFNNGTGTVSFVSEDLTTTEAAIFNAVNSEDLGNIVQSIGFVEDKAYVVANVSNTITVVDRNTFVRETTISEGLNNPRYFIAVNGTGYVSNWGDTADETDDYIAIVNLSTNTVEDTISVVFGPEELIASNGVLYVAHQGAFGQNNQVSVIETASNTVATTITVGDVPNSMQLDGNGDLWVLAGGIPSFTGNETGGVLSKINTSTNEVETNINFGTTQHPNHLSIDGDELYYFEGGNVFTLGISDTTLPETTILDNVSFYAMTVNNGRLYGTDALDFASNGTLLVYDINLATELTTLTVGLIPGGIYFN